MLVQSVAMDARIQYNIRKHKQYSPINLSRQLHGRVSLIFNYAGDININIGLYEIEQDIIINWKTPRRPIE